MRLRHLILGLLLLPAQALAQGALLQGGPWTPGHVPQYVGQGSSQAVVQDGGPARGGAAGVNPSELGLTARGTGTPPYAQQGTGPYGTNFCDYDAPITNATGYHYFCLSPNAQGGGLLAYGFSPPATALPFKFIINGTTYTFPFVTSGIVGPGTTVVGDLACWNNTVGTLLSDCTALPTLTGYIQNLTSPAVSTSPTGNPTGGSLLATYSTLDIQVATAKTNNREFIANIGMTSDVGWPGTNNNGDKVGLYVGAVAGTNSGNIWAVNFLCQLKANLAHAIFNNCNETDLDNHYAHYLTFSPSVYGQINSGAGEYQSTAAMAITGITPRITVSGTANAAGLVRLTVTSTATLQTGFRVTVGSVGGTVEANGVWTMTVIDATHIDLQGSAYSSAYTSGGYIEGPIWRYGFVAINNTANEIAFYDNSDAKTSFSISGVHDRGFDASQSGFTVAPFIAPNNAPYAALNFTGTITNILYLDTSNVTQIGGGTPVNMSSALTGTVINTTGNVGIGVNAAGTLGRLDVKTGTDQHALFRAKQALATGISLYSVNDANNALEGFELSASSFYLTGGNVGVANSSPAYPLDVTGSINASGVYRNGGTAGVSCSGAPSGSFAAVGGIVTHC